MASPQENDSKPETTITLNDSKPETTITLRSNDGEIFEVPETVAVLSVTIRNMVEDGCAGGIIPLEEVDAETLSWVITYLKKHAALLDPSSKTEKDELGAEFFSDKEFNSLLAIVNAANYLNIEELQDASTEQIAKFIRNKGVPAVRKLFGVENDYTPEEEEALRREHQWAHEDGVESDED
ncbi:hypothetical protein ABFX02_06G159600 [Erythranthe guttata]